MTSHHFEKGYPVHEKYEAYMRRRLREEEERLQETQISPIINILNRIEEKLDRLLDDR
jgi:hypothetical protein